MNEMFWLKFFSQFVLFFLISIGGIRVRRPPGSDYKTICCKKLYFIKMPNFDEELGKYKPPNFVFGIVWLILFICLGLSFAYSQTNVLILLLFILLDISLLAWPFFIRFSIKKAFFSLILSLLLTISLISILNNVSLYLMIPLSMWLSFALFLNYLIL